MKETNPRALLDRGERSDLREAAEGNPAFKVTFKGASLAALLDLLDALDTLDEAVSNGAPDRGFEPDAPPFLRLATRRAPEEIAEEVITSSHAPIGIPGPGAAESRADLVEAIANAIRAERVLFLAPEPRE